MNAASAVTEPKWFACAWCRAPLPRVQGQPRFDLFGRFARQAFVCAGSCGRASIHWGAV